MTGEVIDDSAPAPERQPEVVSRKKRLVNDPDIPMSAAQPITNMPIVTDSFPDDAQANAALKKKHEMDYLRRQRGVKTLRRFQARGTKA